MALTVATFNVKNLLEPSGESARAILPRKLDAIAEMLQACDADVVGLQEVGPPEMLREVIARLPRSGYRDPVVGTPDGRGIRCALLSRMTLLDAHVETAKSLSFPVFRVGDPEPFGPRIQLRRGVVHAEVGAPGLGPVRIIVVHFKSPLPVRLRDAAGAEVEPTSPSARAEGAMRSFVSRAAEALYVRKLVDDLLAADPRLQVAVVGDFNDGADSLIVRALRGDREGSLFDCTSAIDLVSRFSVLHEGLPLHVDHVLATENLRAHVVHARFFNEALRDHGPFDPEHEETPTVDSDHAPLVVRFE